MDSSISYEKSSNSLHSFLQQHHQHVQQQQQHQQHLRLNVQHQQHQQQHHQQQLEDNSEKLHSDQSDQENQQSDSCLFSRLQSCTDQNGQIESHLPPFVSCTNPHGIDTILNRRGLVSVAGGSTGNTCTVADTLAAAAACSLQQSAISRYPNSSQMSGFEERRCYVIMFRELGSISPTSFCEKRKNTIKSSVSFCAFGICACKCYL